MDLTRDARCLCHIVMTLVGCNINQYDNNRCLIRSSLATAGVTLFEAHFLLLQEEDILNFQTPHIKKSGIVHEAELLLIIVRHNLIIALALYHDASHQVGKAYDVLKMDKVMFDRY